MPDCSKGCHSCSEYTPRTIDDKILSNSNQNNLNSGFTRISNNSLINRVKNNINNSYTSNARKLMGSLVVAAALYYPVKNDVQKIPYENIQNTQNHDLTKIMLVYGSLVGAGSLFGVKKK